MRPTVFILALTLVFTLFSDKLQAEVDSSVIIHEAVMQPVFFFNDEKPLTSECDIDPDGMFQSN